MHKEYRTIQALRGAAALQVVAFHTLEAGTQRLHVGPGAAWPNGAAGVDLFFVISGFVMVLANAGSNGANPPRAWAFLKRRLERIVPLYWLMTALKIVSVAAAPGFVLRSTLGAGSIVASLLFLPVRDGWGHFGPVLPVGWTLDFEMLFYGLFAASLALRVTPLLFVTPPLLLLAALHGGTGNAALLCDPIVLEFVFGAALASLLRRGVVLDARVAIPLGLVACCSLLILPSHVLPIRLLRWGVPAAIIVACAVSLESRLHDLVPTMLLRLGDASYAIYLSHGFVLAALPILLVHAGSAGSAPALLLGAGLAASAAVGWLVHIAVERPILAAFRRARHAAMPAAVPGAA